MQKRHHQLTSVSYQLETRKHYNPKYIFNTQGPAALPIKYEK